MYQKDYILRLIEQFFKFLAEVLKLIKKGEYSEASDRLESSYYEFLREDATFFHNIPEDTLTHELLQKHNYTNGHLEILAELFNAEAELKYALGDRPGSLLFSRKSLTILEFIDREYKTYSEERIRKMEEIRERITKLDLKH